MAFILDELEKIEQGNLTPVYMLYGDDLYLEEEAINTLSRTFENDAGPVEKKTFYGADKTEDALIQNLVNIGMFSSRQIIIYKDISKLPSSHRKTLSTYLDRPEASTLLILTAGAGQKSALFKKLKGHSSVTTLSIWSPSEHQFPALIQRQLKKKGFSITPEALESLSLATNDSLSHAFAEVEKISVFAAGRNKITIDDVRNVIGGDKSYQISDFINAIEQRNLTEAVHICMALIDTGIESPYIISSLYNFFVNVWAFRAIHQGQKHSYYPAELRRQQFERAYKRYANHDFRALFNTLLEADPDKN